MAAGFSRFCAASLEITAERPCESIGAIGQRGSNYPMERRLSVRMHRLLLIRILLYPTLILVAAGAPYLLWTAELPFIGNTYGNHVEHFELLGFFGTGALLGFAAVELWNKRPVSLEDTVPVLAAVLVGTFFLQLISEYAGRSWDYACYEQAAQRTAVDANPYGSCYIYPPLPAQALAAAYATTGWFAALLHVSVEDVTRWEQVYYGYQCMQILLLLGSYFLCYRFARTLGLSGVMPRSLQLRSSW